MKNICLHFLFVSKTEFYFYRRFPQCNRLYFVQKLTVVSFKGQPTRFRAQTRRATSCYQCYFLDERYLTNKSSGNPIFDIKVWPPKGINRKSDNFSFSANPFLESCNDHFTKFSQTLSQLVFCQNLAGLSLRVVSSPKEFSSISFY